MMVLYAAPGALAGLFIAALLTACGAGEQASAGRTQVCDLVTFVRFDGVRYVPLPVDEPVQVRVGGTYGHVARDLYRDVEDQCDYTPADGDAAGVSKGTPVFEVTGYSPRFLLATATRGNVVLEARPRSEGEVVLWVAQYVPDARTGRDILDIEGKVRRISFLSEVDSTVEMGAIEETGAVQALTAAVLDAPVDRSNYQGGDVLRYLVRFETEEGLRFLQVYRPDIGELGDGIMLPPEARALIAAAVGGE